MDILNESLQKINENLVKSCGVEGAKNLLQDILDNPLPEEETPSLASLVNDDLKILLAVKEADDEEEEEEEEDEEEEEKDKKKDDEEDSEEEEEPEKEEEPEEEEEEEEEPKPDAGDSDDAEPVEEPEEKPKEEEPSSDGSPLSKENTAKVKEVAKKLSAFVYLKSPDSSEIDQDATTEKFFNSIISMLKSELGSAGKKEKEGEDVPPMNKNYKID